MDHLFACNEHAILQEGFSNLLKSYLMRDSARGQGDEDVLVDAFLSQLGVGADVETGPLAGTAQYAVALLSYACMVAATLNWHCRLFACDQ
jgi:hypothetical protein